ncbi:MAG: response regulator [Anaerolineae bacterium]|nr:response regulator [Anaerolineae bacterium]
MIRVALVDDHPLILKILRQELSRALDISVLWDAEDADTIMPNTVKQTPDVLVLDLSYAGRGFDPLTMVRDLRARFPELAILILTAMDDPIWIEEVLKAGAHGYVVKSDDLSLRLAEAIRAVSQGRSFLSPTATAALTQANRKYTLTSRERSILRLAAEGRSNPEIAELLGISDGTVRNHISNIYGKLNVETREAAIRAAHQLRELPNPSANLRHELRTPLHTLLGLARLLTRKLDAGTPITLTEQDAEMLRLILTEAERLDSLIDDLKL